MSIFFKKMNQKEIASWDKAAVAGFYIFLLLLVADQTSNILFNKELFSKSFIFWTGIAAAFGSDLLYRWKSAARADQEKDLS